MNSGQDFQRMVSGRCLLISISFRQKYENFKEVEPSFKGFIKASDVYRHSNEKEEVIIEEKDKKQGEYEDQEEDGGDN